MFFTAFLAIGVAFVSFFYIPFFKVKSISITGNIIIPANDVIKIAEESLAGKYFRVFPRDNIFLISKKDILKNLGAGIPRIKTVRLEREFFDGLSLRITERENKALLCEKEDCAAVDEDGFVFEKSPYISGGIILKFFDQRNSEENEPLELALGKNILLRAQFKKIMDFAKLIPKSGNEVVKIILKKEDIYEFYTEEGWQILTNVKNEPSQTFANLMTTLNFEVKEKRKKLDYVDLRFGNKVYYKFK